MSRSQRNFVEAVAREKGLTIVGPEALMADVLLRDPREIARLKALAALARIVARHGS